MKNARRHRAEWSGKGGAALAVLVTTLLLTGIVLELWDAQALAQLEPWQMQVRRAAVVMHGTGAWVFCFLVGRWVWPHVHRVWKWHGSITWWMGFGSAATALVTTASGWFLLYGSGDLHDSTAALHWWFGLPWPVLLYLHTKRRMRSRAQDKAHANTSPGA